MRKVSLECWLVSAFFLVACAPGRARLPPDASIYPTDEAHDAFDVKLPADATHVAVPAWASLEEVWGTYDPPFTNPLDGPKTVVFGDDDRSLVILGRQGQVRVWDRAQRETAWRSDACLRRASTPETAQDEAQLYLSSGDLAAIGFRSAFFCVMDARTGKKVVDLQAHDMKWNGSTTFLGRLAGSRLVTYAYRFPQSYPLGDGSTRNIEQAGGELRTWDARTGRMLSTVHVGGFAAAALSPDGRLFAAGDGADLRLRDVTGRVLWTKREKVHQLSFATNDHLLALRGAELVEIDVKDGTVRPFPPGYFTSSDEAPYRGVFPSRVGRQALTVLEYGRLMLWDVAARAEVSHALLQWQGTAGWAASPTGAMFVAPGAAVVSAKTLAVIEQPKGPVRFVTLSGSGDRALACRGRAPRPIQFWDATARTVTEWENPNEAYMELASDGARVLVRESERNVLREVATGRVLVNESGHIWTPAALSQYPVRRPRSSRARELSASWRG